MLKALNGCYKRLLPVSARFLSAEPVKTQQPPKTAEPPKKTPEGKRTYGNISDQDRIFSNLYRDEDPFLKAALKRVLTFHYKPHTIGRLVPDQGNIGLSTRIHHRRGQKIRSPRTWRRWFPFRHEILFHAEKERRPA